MLMLVCVHRTWSSTLLQSSNEVFTYGIAGAFWYAAGAVLQVRQATVPEIPYSAGTFDGHHLTVRVYSYKKQATDAGALAHAAGKRQFKATTALQPCAQPILKRPSSQQERQVGHLGCAVTLPDTDLGFRVSMCCRFCCLASWPWR